jgi:hypothetical protein
MPWFPVDDAFHGHPKARRAGFEAIGLWTVAGSYCMAYLTDGFVPEWFVKEKPRGVALAKRLVAAGLWRVGENDGEGGWWFHDWKPECTKAHVLAVRKNARQRKAKSRESQQMSRVTDDVTDASCLVPTQPNPIQSNNPVVTSGGELTQVPPPTCPRHPSGTDKPCGACASARRQHEAWEVERDRVERDELEKRRRQRSAAIAGCPLCDDNGLTETPSGMIRCTHEESDIA